ncbi:NADH-quinone oxidoreductase subunit C [Streptomyces sp. NPDC096323]|uniref:NADH-quinone oxidoreductase subunit C n=1 Tax=Streptomyces sp. NPDC096323 TaxID=3155822 RepID=UPI00333196BE
MSAAEDYDRLPDAVTEIFGEDATAEQAYDLLTVDVPPASWIAALETARDRLGCTYFDWLSAVDEPGTGFRVCAHVAALPAVGGSVRRLLIRTTVPHAEAVLPTAIGVYAGAAWHERETHEMFGIGFDGHPHLVPLLLPEGFEGHPLRKDFVLAARVAKAWPGAKEPGESEHGGPKRRTMLPPGVPDPNEWGPLKGQLPPAPARPARAARPTGDRPARRTRTATDATPSAAEATPVTPATPVVEPGPGTTPPVSGTPAVSGTSAAEPAPGATPARRTRSASQGSASQQAAPAGPVAPGAGPGVGPGTTTGPVAPSEGRPSDAPWHDARPAFDEPSGESRGAGEGGEPDESPRSSGPGEPGEGQPLRRLRSAGPGAEPPVREGAGRGEAPRSATPTDRTPDEPAPEPPTEPPTEQAPEAPQTPQAPKAAPDTPAGGEA